MDTSGCPLGRATDRVFSVRRSGQDTCDNSMVLFWALVGSFLALRALLTLVQIRVACVVTKSRRETRSARKIPITPVLETTFLLLCVLGWVLYGFDIANSSNGGGAAVFMTMILPFMIAFMLSSLKLVRLGNRIIPKQIRKQLVSSRDPEKYEEDKKLGTIQADHGLTILFTTMILGQILAIVSQIVIGTTWNPGSSDLWSQIGMGLEGLVVITGGLIVRRQTNRVVDYIETVHTRQMSIFVGNSGVSDSMLKRTVRMLRLRSSAVGLSVLISSAFFFMCASGIFIPWYILLSILAASLIGATGSTIMYKPAHTPIIFCCCIKKKEKLRATTMTPTSSSKQNQQGFTNNMPMGVPVASQQQNMQVRPSSSAISPSEIERE